MTAVMHPGVADAITTELDTLTSNIAAIDQQLVELDAHRLQLDSERTRLTGWLHELTGNGAPHVGEAAPPPADRTTQPPKASKPANNGTPAKASPTPTAKEVSAGNSKRGPGRPSKYDLAEAARIAREAHDAGGSMQGAVAAALEINLKQAAGVLARAHKAGHDVPKPGAGGSRPNPGPKKADPPATADPPLNPAAASPFAHTPRKGDNVIVCPDCPAAIAFIVLANHRSAMERHIVTVHGREPQRYETLPSTWEED